MPGRCATGVQASRIGSAGSGSFVQSSVGFWDGGGPRSRGPGRSRWEGARRGTDSISVTDGRGASLGPRVAPRRRTQPGARSGNRWRTEVPSFRFEAPGKLVPSRNSATFGGAGAWHEAGTPMGRRLGGGWRALPGEERFGWSAGRRSGPGGFGCAPVVVPASPVCSPQEDPGSVGTAGRMGSPSGAARPTTSSYSVLRSARRAESATGSRPARSGPSNTPRRRS